MQGRLHIHFRHRNPNKHQSAAASIKNSNFLEPHLFQQPSYIFLVKQQHQYNLHFSLAKFPSNHKHNTTNSSWFFRSDNNTINHNHHKFKPTTTWTINPYHHTVGSHYTNNILIEYQLEFTQQQHQIGLQQLRDPTQ